MANRRWPESVTRGWRGRSVAQFSFAAPVNTGEKQVRGGVLPVRIPLNREFNPPSTKRPRSVVGLSLDQTRRFLNPLLLDAAGIEAEVKNLADIKRSFEWTRQ
jgi:hypothetical protein